MPPTNPLLRSLPHRDMLRRLFKSLATGSRGGSNKRAEPASDAASTDTSVIAVNPELSFLYGLLDELSRHVAGSPTANGRQRPSRLRLDLRSDAKAMLSIGWRDAETVWVRHTRSSDPHDLLARLHQHFESFADPDRAEADGDIEAPPQFDVTTPDGVTITLVLTAEWACGRATFRLTPLEPAEIAAEAGEAGGSQDDPSAETKSDIALGALDTKALAEAAGGDPDADTVDDTTS